LLYERAMRNLCGWIFLLALPACEGIPGVAGPTGPAGPAGDNGANGAGGDAGASGPTGAPGCNAAASGVGLVGQLTVEPPANGSYYAQGELITAVIRITDGCAQVIPVANLGTASLYLSGPREGALTKTASKLLNAVTNRSAADRQHHFINLKAPSFADTTQHNLTTAADGTISFTSAPVSDEPAGTYTMGLWLKSTDDKDQTFPLVELQIGTATREVFATGELGQATCFDCHKGPMSGKTYLAHAFPGFSPMGNFSLDSTPIGTCKLCHNLDGYSLNPAVRKIHGAHRGANMTSPGVAHPEYGLGTDTTLAEFTDVEFPSMPDHEKDCAKCHTDDRWKTAPSRLACGTCHDNVFFDTGTLNPPRTFGTPKTGPCATANDCLSFGNLVTCDTADGGICVRTTHPAQSDDAQCATCHTADASGIAAIPTVHEVTQRTRIRGLQMVNVTLTGASGAMGSFQIGDPLGLTFQLKDAAGNLVTDLKTNANLSGTVIVSGPTDDRQRIYAGTSMKTAGTLTFDAGTSTYSYTLPGTIPGTALPPLNTVGVAGRATTAGTYTMWAYINESLLAGAVRDAANAVVDFDLGTTAAIQPRQVISDASCNSCHVTVQAHGGSRQKVGSACSVCHTPGAVDRTNDGKAKGIACTTDAQCPGFAAGWEQCKDTNNDGVADACIIGPADPTPGQPIDFRAMIHEIHYARVRGGYAERNNLVSPGDLVIVGFNNTPNDFNDILFPQDIRNCTKCHSDAGGTCSASKPCGVGQRCTGGTCQNVAWLQPSATVCLSCHDEDSVFGHAALQTWMSPDGPVETCETCHGEGAAFSVDKVHNISNPYVPPYPRTKE
jgi:hypothetical protein